MAENLLAQAQGPDAVVVRSDSDSDDYDSSSDSSYDFTPTALTPINLSAQINAELAAEAEDDYLDMEEDLELAENYAEAEETNESSSDSGSGSDSDSDSDSDPD